MSQDPYTAYLTNPKNPGSLASLLKTTSKKKLAAKAKTAKGGRRKDKEQMTAAAIERALKDDRLSLQA